MPSKRKQAAAAKRTRGRKKIVLFLVEGLSDQRALEVPLDTTCEGFDRDITTYFRYPKGLNSTADSEKDGGDVTSKYGINPGNIERMIDKFFLRPFFDEEHLYPKDITRIIHLVDTDGAFIPDSNVVSASSTSDKTEYGEDLILASNVDEIQERNALKRDNLLHLLSLESIKTGFDRRKKAMPYSIYFFSANLDHFLHGDANLERTQKIVQADDFSRKCCFQPSLFYDMIFEDAEYTQCSYQESWEKIQTGCNSLKRHSNLGLLLSELKTGCWS